MNIRKKVKDNIYPPIYDLIKYYFYRYIKGSFFAKDNLDKKLLNYLDYKNGYFVELGANNGFNQSNTLYFELKKNWHGILIEPAPNLYLECCFFRRNIKNKIFCNACVGFDYNKEFVEISYANLMSTSSSIDLDIPDLNEYASKQRFSIQKYEKNLSFGSKAITLDALLKKSDAPKIIDLLSLDVEGAELEVLSGLKFNEYSFKYILVETRVPNKINDFFVEKGYEFIEYFSQTDMLFCKKK
jgi:FkbM family methyltransferase